jgi:hypothetical protein
MITFNVVKEQQGWSIRTGTGMTTPFRTRDAAIREAKCLADSIRGHGECVEVIVEHIGPIEVRDRRPELHLNIANILSRRRITGAP